MAASRKEGPACPGCAGVGRRVKPQTLASLLRPEALARLPSMEGFRFCATPDCPVAYHDGGGGRIDTTALKVRVGLKVRESPRPICYCFGHTIEEVEEEVRRTGRSSITETVALACRRGEDRCESENPRGACCLGDLRRIAADAAAVPGPPEGDCCGS